jgi:hypothetical protein
MIGGLWKYLVSIRKLWMDTVQFSYGKRPFSDENYLTPGINPFADYRGLMPVLPSLNPGVCCLSGAVLDISG